MHPQLGGGGGGGEGGGGGGGEGVTLLGPTYIIGIYPVVS